MKKLFILIAFAVLLISGVLILKSGNFGTQALWNLSNGGQWIFPLVTAGALIDAINPCAFSVLILTIAFLFSLGKARSDILKIGGFYIFGLFVIYILIGLGILQAFHLFNTPRFMSKAAAVLLIILGGVGVIGELFPSFPLKLKILPVAHQKMAQLMAKASIPTAFLLGALVGLCEFPCTGGPYLVVLGLLHDKTTLLSGLIYLLYYNLLFVLPLVIVLFIAGNKNLLEKVQNWKREKTREMKIYSGLAMIVLGAIILLL